MYEWLRFRNSISMWLGSKKILLESHLLPWYHPGLYCWHVPSQEDLHWVVDEQGTDDKEGTRGLRTRSSALGFWWTKRTENPEANSIYYASYCIIKLKTQAVKAGRGHAPSSLWIFTETKQGERLEIDHQTFPSSFLLCKARSSRRD